ncbi:hypothetical protein [Phenylobacterium sp.]|uniref:hypothetical protein n=1 Tax=Phenylobacterium sp. TaxID=1871053 RepID=UPI0025EF5A75|nr:hypothetical protein [Phenylobacterium sp.]
MSDQNPERRPEQQAGDTQQRQPEQQSQQKHHDPQTSGGGNLASQTPTGGTSQDSFGQSGKQGSPDQAEHNARPGGDV